MAIDEVINENCIIRDAKTGKVFMTFRKPEHKEGFLKMLEEKVGNTKNYTCGDCVAYPCFRTPSSEYFSGAKTHLSENPKIREKFEKWAKDEASRSAGFCFQKVRLCRQECDNYKYDKHPAPEGVCKIDGVKVEYNQECHIESIKGKKKLI